MQPALSYSSFINFDPVVVREERRRRKVGNLFIVKEFVLNATIAKMIPFSINLITSPPAIQPESFYFLSISMSGVHS
jgi:hypothetical protein